MEDVRGKKIISSSPLHIDEFSLKYAFALAFGLFFYLIISLIPIS